MSFEGIDEESLRLIIEIQLSDLESASKGKHTEGGATPDSELAISAYRKELESLSWLTSDRTMSRSIAHAVELDSHALATHAQVEQQAARDRQQALAGGSTHSVAARTPVSKRPVDPVDYDTLSRFNALRIDNKNNDDDDDGASSVVAESSSWAASRRPLSKEPKADCEACGEAVFSRFLIRSPCGHGYCPDCMTEIFQGAIRDESRFPPRCCRQKILTGAVEHLLAAPVLAKFRKKEVEYSTTNRTYCHQIRCAEFIPPSSIIGDVAVCPKCTGTTCSACKGPAHDGSECLKDNAIQDVLSLASQMGWQRCSKCGRVLELTHGCNHMTCKCSAEFCYECGVKWKECCCATWQEDRLIMRANELVDRNVPNAAMLGVRARQELVERARQDVVENHQCNHERWVGRGGIYDCENCFQRFYMYIFRCRRCSLQACYVCRHHRL